MGCKHLDDFGIFSVFKALLFIMLYPFYTPYSTLSEKEKKGKKPGSKKFFRYVIKCSYIFDKILRKFSGSSRFSIALRKSRVQNTGKNGAVTVGVRDGRLRVWIKRMITSRTNTIFTGK